MKPYENGIIVEGPIELAVITQAARLVEREIGAATTSSAFLQGVGTLEATMEECRELAVATDPAAAECDLKIPLIGQNAKIALALVAMNARRHPNLVTRAAALAMENDYNDNK
jgi:hypothetical protein